MRPHIQHCKEDDISVENDNNAVYYPPLTVKCTYIPITKTNTKKRTMTRITRFTKITKPLMFLLIFFSKRLVKISCSNIF